MNFYKDFWANNGEKPYWVDDDRTFLEDYFSGELESSGLTTDQKREMWALNEPTRKAVKIMEESLEDEDVDIEVRYSDYEQKVIRHYAKADIMLSICSVLYPVLVMMTLTLLYVFLKPLFYNKDAFIIVVLTSVLLPAIIVGIAGLSMRNYIDHHAGELEDMIRHKARDEAHKHFKTRLSQKNRVRNTKKMLKVLARDIEISDDEL
ncbi:hypothetical protein IKE07_02540 [Candidatus Saccharibacteria bacterium]|nr:hypothetical protein [Candidatus Saccharibacteria bacterium]